MDIADGKLMVSGFGCQAFWLLVTCAWLLASSEKPDAKNDEPLNVEPGTPELVFHNLSIGCKSQKTPGDAAAGLDQIRNNF